MRCLFAIALMTASTLAAPASAQWINDISEASFDVGAGISYGPGYFGDDETELGPWGTMRNLTLGTETGEEKQGFSLIPSFGYIGTRKDGDHKELHGLDNIDWTAEVGLRVNYVDGDATSYGAMRVGIGGHDGLVGEIGTKYRFIINDKLTLWTTAELQLGDDSFTDTYFGVTADESAASNFREYDPSGGIYAANIGLEARYSLTPKTSILGKITYGRLLNDAGDSPIVRDRNQPEINLGIARRLNFRF
ncbi:MULTISPECIES: MipA/OmpV family protein [Paracoccus]|uniref:MipA/OmpV family protein n=1 Tax=Paracoccus litorisediminis TaxID=2006130 RepID=A0A844HEF1_9RHOB|nr:MULTISPECIES: MipA/OmpV family protein [Paracoccus]MBD9525373.1 MipA/OmpV family protein [Paracoccus sp. PAR01]MTH57803.1 MipA/OmpV family protein [Paracoccus litorisediminis]